MMTEFANKLNTILQTNLNDCKVKGAKLMRKDLVNLKKETITERKELKKWTVGIHSEIKKVNERLKANTPKRNRKPKDVIIKEVVNPVVEMQAPEIDPIPQENI